MREDYNAYMCKELGEEALTEDELKNVPDFSIISRSVESDLRSFKGTKIPYAFTVGVISVAGYVCIENATEDSYLRGYHHIGPIPGSHHINKHNTHADFSAEIVKVRIGMDVRGKYFYWQVANLELRMCGLLPCTRWQWHGKNVIYRW
jgi:hypothetical protein